MCLMLNASVNAYRRLDPHFEAPNQIKASAVDRGSMVRVPIGNERSSRVEVRSVAPDANPYIVLSACSRPASTARSRTTRTCAQAERYLPDNIYDALADFRKSAWITTMFGDDVKGRYAELKQASADRCPRLLGHLREAGGSAVPPRDLQPVPLEPVLDPEHTLLEAKGRSPVVAALFVADHD